MLLEAPHPIAVEKGHHLTRRGRCTLVERGDSRSAVCVWCCQYHWKLPEKAQVTVFRGLRQDSGKSFDAVLPSLSGAHQKL